MHMPTKNYLRKNGSNCDRKSQLSGILTEPLNPRGLNFINLASYPTFSLRVEILCILSLYMAFK